ncbi:MAG TPA: aldehyde ferredoxin oxidoreductase N-terminal domain-containing protein [bacterium]|nr:aldehyde ferredoxin oxidoreductase N-terminal domain-containing protein [bacterium]
MEIVNKKALIVDLNKRSSEVKGLPDLRVYIGGLGLGLALYEMYRDKDPVIFSVGPLNGFFPFASKTSIVLSDDGVMEDLYIGGNLSTRMKFSGLDSIVICGRSEDRVILDISNTSVSIKTSDMDINTLGLPGKRSILSVDYEKNNVLVQSYFSTPDYFLYKTLSEKNIMGMVVTGTEFHKPNNFSDYENLYQNILNKINEVRVEKGIYPSCSNCPMGCGKSKFGEIGGNVLVHSLVSCHYADKIYSDLGIVFSCLNVLGYDYTHEDLENLPVIVEETLKRLN